MKVIDFNEENNTMLVVLNRHQHHMEGHRGDARKMGFQPKDEFHITVLGYKAGKIITEQLNANRDLLEPRYIAAVSEFICSTHDYLEDFEIPVDCEMRIIEKKYDYEYRKSLVYILDPAEHQLRFYHKMEALFPGIKQHLPIPHVTIGVDGDHPGIGFTPYVKRNELTNNFLVAYPK